MVCQVTPEPLPPPWRGDGAVKSSSHKAHGDYVGQGNVVNVIANRKGENSGQSNIAMIIRSK